MSFDKILNRESNKVGVICGLGPSLGKYLNAIYTLQSNPNYRNDYCFITCNEFDKMTQLTPDYYVTSSSVDKIEKTNRLKKFSNLFYIFARSVDTITDDEAEKYVQNFISYDQRHFDGKPCSVKSRCCDFIKDELTIQEYLSKLSGIGKLYSPGDSVALHMTAIAIILGCNPIYIVGVDLDYSLGYVNSYQPEERYGLMAEPVIRDFGIIKEAADALGVKIFNLSSNRMNNLFPNSDIWT